MTYLPKAENLSRQHVTNTCQPDEGTFIIPLQIPFTSTQTLITVPLVQLLTKWKMKGVQGLYIYNPSAVQVLIGVPESKQSIPVPPGFAGYVEVLVPNDAVITFTSLVTVDTVLQVQLLNFPVRTAMWAISASGSSPSTPFIVEEIATLATDRSGTIAAAGVSQQAMAANASAVERWVYNPDALTESLWINIYGAVAVPNAAGAIEIQPGTGWAGKTTNAIQIVAATLGHKFTAGER